MTLSLNAVINKFQNTKWTKINNFSIFIQPANMDFAKIVGFEPSADLDEKFNISLVSIDTPEYNNAEIAEFTGTRWRYHTGRDELFRFDMTFRDSDQMSLYRLFLNIYNKGKGQYPSKIFFIIKVYLDEDIGVSSSLLFETRDAMLENVSKLQFSHNTENQVAEFSVRFKCNPPIHTETQTA